MLHYTNPPAVGFRLEVDPATNDTQHLVLNLQGPKGTQAFGVAFFLAVGEDAVGWAAPPKGTGFFRCGRGWEPGGSEPRLARAKVQGGLIQVGLFQRDKAAVWLGTTPILSLALDLKSGAAPGKVDFWAPLDRKAVYLDANRILHDLPVGLGELVVQQRAK